MANTMKNWNLTIQWWMSNFVHRKLPFKNRNLRQGKFFCFLFITLILQGYKRSSGVELLEWPIFVTLHIIILIWFLGFLVSHISIFGLVSFVPKVCNFAQKAVESCQNFNIIIIEHGPSVKPLSKGLKMVSCIHKLILMPLGSSVNQLSVGYSHSTSIYLFISS